MSQFNSPPDLIKTIQSLTARVAALENASGTGWVPLELPAGVDPGTDSVPAVRIEGSIAYLCGSPTITSGSPTAWAVIPPAALPRFTATYGPLVEDMSGGIAGFLMIDSVLGQITGTSAFGVGETAHLNGLSYPLN